MTRLAPPSKCVSIIKFELQDHFRNDFGQVANTSLCTVIARLLKNEFLMNFRGANVCPTFILPGIPLPGQFVPQADALEEAAQFSSGLHLHIHQ